MNAARAADELATSTRALHDALIDVRTTVRADAPRIPEGLPAPVERLGDAIDDLVGTAEAMRGLTRALRGRAFAVPRDLDALADLTDLRVRAWSSYLAVCSFDAQSPLDDLARSGEGWALWTRAFRDGLAHVECPLVDVTRALDARWQEGLLTLAACRAVAPPDPTTST